MKKIDFDLSKYQIFCVVCRKKWFLEIKIQICVYYVMKKKKKKRFFDNIKIKYIFICFKIMKKIFEEESFTHNLNLRNMN